MKLITKVCTSRLLISLGGLTPIAKESNDKIRNLESIKKELEYKRATIDNRFPYSRYGNKRDTYSYNRVRNLLFELKNIILNHGYRIVTKSSLAQESFQIAGTEDRVKCWKYCTDYLQIATSIAQDLPEFDLSQNNTYKHETLTSLAALFSTVISRMEDSEFTTKNVQSINSLNRFLSRISKRFPEHFGYVYSELLKRIGSDW